MHNADLKDIGGYRGSELHRHLWTGLGRPLLNCSCVFLIDIVILYIYVYIYLCVFLCLLETICCVSPHFTAPSRKAMVCSVPCSRCFLPAYQKNVDSFAKCGNVVMFHLQVQVLEQLFQISPTKRIQSLQAPISMQK